MYLNRLEVLAGTYERLDTVMNSVLVVVLKFESCDRQRMQDTMVARLWVRMPLVSCMACNGAAVCLGSAQETKAEVERSAKKNGLKTQAVPYLIMYAESLTDCLIENYENLHS